MKRPGTIFDKQLDDEDRTVPGGGGTDAPDGCVRLLRRCNTEIFDPLPGELDAPSEEKIDLLMRKTAAARRLACGGRRPFPWRLLALAASVMLVFGIGFQLWRMTNVSPGRGGEPETCVAVIKTVPESPAAAGEAPSPGVAERPACSEPVLRFSYTLDNAVSRIAVVGNKAPEKLSRKHYSAPAPAAAKSAAVLKRAVAVAVHSPCGASYSATPPVMIAGDPETSYEVSIRDADGAVVGKLVDMRGGTVRPWSDFSAAPPPEGKSYVLCIRYDGKVVNVPGESAFRRLPGREREKLSQELRSAEALKDGSERALARSRAFYKYGCRAEALLAIEPHKDDSAQHRSWWEYCRGGASVDAER